MTLHLDKTLDQRVQAVWDAYMADPKRENTVAAMSIYDVKSFKPQMCVIGGRAIAIEAAKKEGLQTHPQMKIFPETTTPVETTFDASKSRRPPPAPVLPMRSAPARTPRTTPPQPDQSTSPGITQLQPPPPRRTWPPSSSSRPPRRRQPPSSSPSANNRTPLRETPPITPPKEATPPANTEPPVPGPSTTGDTTPATTPAPPSGRGYARPGSAPGRIKFGDFSIEVDSTTYTEYEQAVSTPPNNANDGWETLVNRLLESRYSYGPPALQLVQSRLHLGPPPPELEYTSETGKTTTDEAIMLRPSTVEPRIATTPKSWSTDHAGGRWTNPSQYPPDYYFMANIELTSAAKRECTQMTNIYACRHPDDFQRDHAAITQQVQRTDQTLRYAKGWLYYLSVLEIDAWAAQMNAAAPFFNPAYNANVVNATTIYYDAPAVQNPPNTRAFLAATNNNTSIPSTPASAPRPTFSSSTQ